MAALAGLCAEGEVEAAPPRPRVSSQGRGVVQVARGCRLAPRGRHRHAVWNGASGTAMGEFRVLFPRRRQGHEPGL
eukprot:7831352-Pyramimonas_sp.AAC.1